MQILQSHSFTHNLIGSCPIVLIFCIEQGSDVAMPCAEFLNDWRIAIGVIGERVLSLRWVSNGCPILHWQQCKSDYHVQWKLLGDFHSKVVQKARWKICLCYFFTYCMIKSNWYSVGQYESGNKANIYGLIKRMGVLTNPSQPQQLPLLLPAPNGSAETN